MSYVVGAILGVVGGLACVWVIGDTVGIVAGLGVAALLYLGVGRLFAPEAQLGDVAASLVPNGETVATRIAEARELEDKVRKLGARAGSHDVRAEATQLVDDVERLTAYVEKQPATYRRLAHFLSTYGKQCSSVLENYLAIERAATGDAAVRAHADVVEALNALQGAAQGELARVTGSKAAELSADSDAVKRLMEMDGYTADARPVDTEVSAAAGNSDANGRTTAAHGRSGDANL